MQVVFPDLVEVSHDAALDQRPEAFNGLGVDSTNNILAESGIGKRPVLSGWAPLACAPCGLRSRPRRADPVIPNLHGVSADSALQTRGPPEITGWMQRTVVMAGAAAMQPADGSGAAPQIGARFISSNFTGIVMAGQVRR